MITCTACWFPLERDCPCWWNEETIMISNDPKIDNVWEYHLTKNQRNELDVHWYVTVNINQKANK